MTWSVLRFTGLFTLLAISSAVRRRQADSPLFKIGTLLPEIKALRRQMTSDDMHAACHSDQLAVVTQAIGFANEQLNELFRQLYGCNVDLNLADTQCDISLGTRSFFELAKDIQRTLFVFSGSCDTVIKPIAESVQFFNLTMLSYTETDPTFSDPVKYNGFYRLVPSEEQHNYLRIHLIKKFQWTRIGTIYLTKARYTLAHNMLIRELDQIVNETISRSVLENQAPSQYTAVLDDFIHNDIKIIIGIFDLNTTIKLFCEIFKKGMFGKNYQWIIVGIYNKEMLYATDRHKSSNCSTEELLIALNGTLQTRVVEFAHEFDPTQSSDRRDVDDRHLALPPLMPPDESPPLVARKRPGKPAAAAAAAATNSIDPKSRFDEHTRQIVQTYLNKVKEQRTKSSSSAGVFTDAPQCFNSYFHGYAFDVMLAMFKSLSLLIENNKFSCYNWQFERNIQWFTHLSEAFNKISFKGITGNVTFKNGSRIGQIKLEQLITKPIKESRKTTFLEIKEVLITVHDHNENKFFEKNEIKWHGKNPPTDHTKTIRILYKIPKGIFISISILTTAGILLAFAFLVFNIKFRKHRFIKMSSPYLNNLIIVGCLLSYVSIYFLGEYEGLINKNIFKYICVIRVWLLTISFTFAFGAMFSKTYRVHAILTNYRLTKKVIKDYKLFGIVIFLLVIDMVILISWQIFDPLKIAQKQYQVQNNGETMILIDNLVCESNHIKIWIASLFSYKSLLILFGCFFAYETRHVTISALNDSKYIGISVYNVLIMCSAGAAIAFIVHNKDAAFILITLFIFCCTTITLCLVFLPKIYEVRKDPVGKKKPKPKTTFKKGNERSRISQMDSSIDFDKKIKLLDEENKAKMKVIERINLKIDALVEKAKELKSSSLKDCLRIVGMDDAEIQKYLLTVENKLMPPGGFETENSATIRNYNNDTINDMSQIKCKNLNAADDFNAVVNATFAANNIDQIVMLRNNSAKSKRESLVSNCPNVPKIEITMANVIDHTQSNNICNPPVSPSRPKRKFNPPPQIIDLSKVLVDKSGEAKIINRDCYVFKIDI